MGECDPLETQALNRIIAWRVVVDFALNPDHLDQLWYDNIIAWLFIILWPVIEQALLCIRNPLSRFIQTGEGILHPDDFRFHIPAWGSQAIGGRFSQSDDAGVVIHRFHRQDTHGPRTIRNDNKLSISGNEQMLGRPLFKWNRLVQITRVSRAAPAAGFTQVLKDLCLGPG